MNGVFFACLKTSKRFRFHKAIISKVASISVAFKTSPLLRWYVRPFTAVFKRNGASSSLRIFDRRKAAMTSTNYSMTEPRVLNAVAAVVSIHKLND